MELVYDAIIVGSGPAGLTSGLYTSRARLSTLVIEQKTPGGRLIERDKVENYPGYPDGVLGPELASRMLTQTMNCGAETVAGQVEGLLTDGDYRVVRTSTVDYVGRAVIIASGALPKKLGVPGEVEFANKGVFYCATCDGPRMANKIAAVAGGGDSGVTEALLLARIASKVVIVEALQRMSASKILQERVASDPRIEVRCGVQIEQICGDQEVKSLNLVNTRTKRKDILEVQGVLVWVGLQANTAWLKGTIPLDERGQIIVDTGLGTTIPGVFAAGDVRQHSPMQISTAVGDGATAALSAIRYLGTR
jgi:thioredoxin reductase (NADPH)